MSDQQKKALPVLFAALALMSRPARADFVSTFDSGGEGWGIVSFTNLTNNDFTILSTTSPTFHASGGNPGGFISATDPDNGDFTFSAPASFLGNDSAATGISYELSYPRGGIDYQTTDLVLAGNGLRLVFKSNPDIVPRPSFMPISIAFTPSSGWHVGTNNGPLATAADFQSVLGNLSGIFIRGEYSVGLVEEPGLDNVRLIGVGSVPEPSAFVLFGSALLPAAALIARRGRDRRADPDAR
jgi:hypothetical protein